jgi:hypothetical protein
MDHWYIGFFKFQPNKYGPLIFPLVPFMPLYGRQLQCGPKMATNMTFFSIRKSQPLKINLVKGQLYMEEKANTVWRFSMKGHIAHKNKIHVLNFNFFFFLYYYLCTPHFFYHIPRMLIKQTKKYFKIKE